MKNVQFQEKPYEPKKETRKCDTLSEKKESSQQQLYVSRARYWIYQTSKTISINVFKEIKEPMLREDVHLYE